MIRQRGRLLIMIAADGPLKSKGYGRGAVGKLWYNKEDFPGMDKCAVKSG